MTDNDHVKALKDELRAIERIDKILAGLDPVVQQRVVGYLVDRYTEGQPT